MDAKNCHCSSGKEIATCCARFIDHDENPANPEELMRARFVAYATEKVDFILKTEMLKRPNTKPNLERACKTTSWEQLRVVNSSENGLNGIVNFEARFSRRGQTFIMRERATYKKFGEMWYYIGGRSSYIKSQNPRK